MVKLEMIFYKTGYTRIPRVVSITGAQMLERRNSKF